MPVCTTDELDDWEPLAEAAMYAEHRQQVVQHQRAQSAR